MCEPATITAYATAAAAAASVAQVAMAPKGGGGAAPAIAPVEKPPEAQAAKMPDEAGRRATQAAAVGGPGAGVGSTFLTGPQGISNTMLTLGKNTLLGA